MSPKIFLSPNNTRMKISNFASFGRKLGRSFTPLFRPLVLFCSNYIFFVKLSYFFTFSLVGYLALSVSSKPRNISITSSNANGTSTSSVSIFKPKQLDLFFTSVSATTVSSMSTVEMEVFSNSQLILLTILMVLGGEVFTSMLEIHIERAKLAKNPTKSLNRIGHELSEIPHSNHLDIENQDKPNLDVDTECLKHSSGRYLGHVVLGYLLVVHVVGSLCVFLYITFSPSSSQVLKTKGIKTPTFSIFTIVSTFANCGFVPTNENMIVFKSKSGLLLLLIAQILLGNTLYPFFLRFTIWVLEQITRKREFNFLLKNHREVGYDHLLSSVHSTFLALTMLGFILVQIILFCSLEWNLEALDGMSWYQKFVASLFQVVNSRHAGEYVVDISTISSAILVLFVIMMYLPPYTSFLPVKDDQEKDSTKSKISGRKTILEYFTLSQLSYLAIFVILICITEREKIKSDPLNFNVLNIIIEVTSAYGNVGFSTGYSCKRRLNREGDCIDKWYGFAGKWSPEGKFILIVVMFFGRLKKYSMKAAELLKNRGLIGKGVNQVPSYLLLILHFIFLVGTLAFFTL